MADNHKQFHKLLSSISRVCFRCHVCAPPFWKNPSGIDYFDSVSSSLWCMLTESGGQGSNALLARRVRESLLQVVH